MHKTILIAFVLVHNCESSILLNSSISDDNDKVSELVDYVETSASYEKEKQQRRVYLEDVFYSLKSQRWSDEDLPCLNHTLNLLTSLQNFTLWAATIWDATLSEPLGFLTGSPYQLSNYDECLRPGWSQKHNPQLRTQYCLADVRLIQTETGQRAVIGKEQLLPYDSVLDKMKWDGDATHERGDELSWGICAPASCSPEAVKRLVIALILRSNLAVTGLSYEVTVGDDSCQTDRSDEELSGGSIAFISTCAVFLSVGLACTTYHWYYSQFQPQMEKDASRWLLSFSLMKNFHELPVCGNESTRPLYGIRFLSICFIVACHRTGMFLGGPIYNGEDAEKVYTKSASVFVSHADLVVDSFFVLSGFLTAFGLLSHGKPVNLIVLILKRYIRLAPALAMTIFFMATLFWQIGDGPLWKRMITEEVNSCRRNSWTNMLMISNYVNTNDFCMQHSWYVPTDFQLFVIASLLYCLYVKSRKAAFWSMAVLFLASVLVPAAITYNYRYPGLLLFLKSFTKQPRESEAFRNIYIHTHQRAGAYFVGTILGYVFVRGYPIKDTKKMSIKKSCLFALLGSLLMFGAIFSAGAFYTSHKEYIAEEAAAYAALDRPMWAIGLALIIVATSYGHVPFLSSFLRWSPFIPLSKLAYGIYLVHTVGIIRSIATTRMPQYFYLFNLFAYSLSDIVLAGFVSLAMLLFLEMPIQNVLKLCLEPSKGKEMNIPKPDEESPRKSSIESFSEKYSTIVPIPSIVPDKQNI